MKTFSLHIRNSATNSDVRCTILAKDMTSAMIRANRELERAGHYFGGQWKVDDLTEKVKP
jgi:hypothetical protein